MLPHGFVDIPVSEEFCEIGAGFKAKKSFEFKAKNFGFKAKNFKFMAVNFGFKVKNFGFKENPKVRRQPFMQQGGRNGAGIGDHLDNFSTRNSK